MRLSTRGRHAVSAVVDLADRSRERPVPLAAIAAQQAISLSYLEQIFSGLRQAGVVQSVRGPGGGYRLARPASSLTIADIVLAVEGRGGAELSGGPIRPSAATEGLWRALDRHVHAFLDSVSVQDMIDGRLSDAGENAGHMRDARQAPPQ